MSEPAVSVLIATRNRAALLPHMLESLAIAQATAAVATEVIVVDNGSSDTTPALLAEWQHGAADRVVLRVDEPGKSRSLNRAIDTARAPLLAFVDDDERVAPDWLAAIGRFATAHPEYDAGSGRVLPPPDLWDFAVLERVAWYRTIPFFDGGDTVHAVQTLHGANMMLRRSVFARIGRFNEALGPGAAGALEEIELAQRLCAAGLSIGYMPDVVTYHSIDPARLTLDNFRHYCRTAARSTFVIDQHSWRRACGRLIEASLGFAWWSLRGNPLRREHARGRMLRHAELVRLRVTGEERRGST